MFRLIVLTAWLSLIPALVYRFRKAEPIHGFLSGFLMVWHSIVTLSDKGDLYQDDSHLDGWEQGIGTGVISAFIVGIALIVFAGFTIYWAG